MSLQVSDLLRSALLKGGAIRKNESADAGEMQDALSALTVMLHSWAARKLMVRATIQESKVLTANVGSYTIGTGGAFNTPKPFVITGAFIRDSNNVDTGVDIVTRDVYDSYQDKAISVARPVALFYDPGAAQQATQLGTIYLYYVPDNSTVYTLFIDSTKPFTDFTGISDTVTFEAPYEEAIIYELAVRLWREYHGANVPIPRDIYEIANEAMHTVETMNAKQLICGLDLPGMKGQNYNIYLGGYNE